jgi:hypothetical protein
MKRSDGNYSAWADFKEWTDVEFARAIERGTRAIHAADPGAYSAIEGGQIPGWGGYDYSRLASAVDLMELGDGGGNVEILRSLNPNLILLRTSFDSVTLEIHAIWRSLLRGGRGVIFWDPEGGIGGDVGSVGDRGNRVAAVLREIKGGLGALLIHSKRQVAPIAVLYSPPSMRMQWMLDWQPRGTAWSDRDPSEVYEDENLVRSSMTAFLDFLGRVGLEPRVVTPELIEKGALHSDIRVLILPRVLALSEREAAEMRRFVARGGAVIADGVPGSFDQHGRRLTKPLLAGLFRKTPRKGKSDATFLDTPLGRGDELMHILAAAGVEPAFTITRPDGSRVLNIETQLWRNGTTTILALQRDAGEAAGEPESVLLTLRDIARVYDLRAGALQETARSLELPIDPIGPTLLALSAGPGSTPTIAGAARVVADGTAMITFSLPQAKATGPAVVVLRVELLDPFGEVVSGRSVNLLLHGVPVAKRFDFASDDATGKWRIRATDVLTGNSASKDLEVATY